VKLGKKQKAAFGFGAFGKDVVYMLISSYLLYYYNVVLGMSSVFIGTIMMAARIFDAFNDPFMGIIVAKTKTRWGRFRPWILAGTVLNAVTIYALYATPVSMAESGQRIWLTVFYFAWGITYTFMDIPFWSMIPAITEPGDDREQLTSLARTCSGIGDAVPTVLTMTVVPILSASSVVADYRIGFKWWALIIAIVFVISEVVCVVAVPERPVEMDLPTVKVSEMFKSLFRNDQAMTVVLSIILVYTSLNICGNLVLYFFQFDVGNEGAYSLFAAVAFAAQVVTMMVIPLFRKKFTKAQLFLAGFVVQIVGFFVILIMAYTNLYTPEHWQVLCLPGILIYAGYGMLNVIMTIFLSDSVDYGEVKNGTRDESVIFSMQTFTVKLASGIAVFLAGLVVKWIGLQKDAPTQTDATLQGLRMWMTIPSVILLIIGIIVFLKFYRLNDEKMKEIKEELEALHN
jgi:melibiose permease